MRRTDCDGVRRNPNAVSHATAFGFRERRPTVQFGARLTPHGRAVRRRSGRASRRAVSRVPATAVSQSHIRARDKPLELSTVRPEYRRARPYVPASKHLTRAHRGRPRPRRPPRARLRRVERLPRAQGRAHRERVDPDRGALDHDLPLAPRAMGNTEPHDPREQHRADDRLGRRVGRRGRRCSRCPRCCCWASTLPWSKVAAIAVVGGLLGVLMMIPLRRALIVKEHGKLKYPEGTACAEVLIVGEERGVQARDRVHGLRPRRRSTSS